MYTKKWLLIPCILCLCICMKKFTTGLFSWGIFVYIKNIYIFCTLRCGLHEITTLIRTFPHGLENNHARKWTCNNFQEMLTYVFFLENCPKNICIHSYSPIYVDSIKARGQICPILWRRKRTLPRGLENNHAYKWI